MYCAYPVSGAHPHNSECQAALGQRSAQIFVVDSPLLSLQNIILQGSDFFFERFSHNCLLRTATL